MPEEPRVGAPGISRRRILIGAAWTAPAIVLATAAPAVAASGPAQFTITGNVTYRNGAGLMLTDRISSNALTVTNTGGKPAVPTVRFSFTGLAVATGLPAPPRVTGWNVKSTVVDLGNGVGLLGTWVYTRQGAVHPGEAVPFPGFSDHDLLLTPNGVRVGIHPPDNRGPTTIVRP